MAAAALLFSLSYDAVQNRKSARSEGGACCALGLGVLARGLPSLLPVLGRKCILEVTAAELWTSAFSIPVSPPDPVAEVGSTYT